MNLVLTWFRKLCLRRPITAGIYNDFRSTSRSFAFSGLSELALFPLLAAPPRHSFKTNRLFCTMCDAVTHYGSQLGPFCAPFAVFSASSYIIIPTQLCNPPIFCANRHFKLLCVLKVSGGMCCSGWGWRVGSVGLSPIARHHLACTSQSKSKHSLVIT